MAHGDAREGKWSGNCRMEWVASTLHTTSEHAVSRITTADAHTSAASSRLNWLVRFAEIWNLVSARVPSHFKRSLLPDHLLAVLDARTLTIQVLLPDSSLQTMETLIHFRSEGQQEVFCYSGSMYAACSLCSQCQMCGLVREMLVVCRVSGVATYRRRDDVCPPVRLQDYLARFAYAYTS